MTAEIIRPAFKGSIRQAPTLVEEGFSFGRQALGAALARTPHARIGEALRRLSATGQTHTADMANQLIGRALAFPLPDGRPHPEYVALAVKELASVPSELPASFRHASSAARALMELAFPETTTPGAA